ncbi:hypothetical protein M406DRAFT_253841 [Cryphonectria parasitica EP155]|uniref:WSC domain-containing protein n=1 Tax=Cryphonectria parasitica (strain ATCC 38755 / EP155) TaxID=660469 RepID=A0A9P4Y5Y0_CRYP1|nr:uncharacterized protein M406DRAFT_253841 [Cryphonectria parasitica EP155]KAF3767574.1 hypothetical protein M406DRAFT_253841 [Cryphonectria parasitica EP155]
MSFVSKSAASLGALVALASLCVYHAAATPSVAIAYCASINTGTTAANSSIYMSEGLCYDQCNDEGYALAVLQDEDCWCADYVPDSDDQVDTSKCDTACPGYPSDYCGGDDLYGYLALDAAVSGTSGGTSSTATSTSTTHTSSTAKTTTTSDTPTVVTSVQTVTSDGTVIYQTVTSIAKASSGSGGLSKGAIAGLVIGILAILAAFVAGAILYRRHKKAREQAEQAPLAAAMAAAHRRGSSAGIMSKTGTISSHGYGLPMEEDTSYGSPSRRMSMKPMDPRLDPKQTFGLYRAASHDSINTLRDDQDYSRRVHEPTRALRVFNPDPVDDN